VRFDQEKEMKERVEKYASQEKPTCPFVLISQLLFFNLSPLILTQTSVFRQLITYNNVFATALVNELGIGHCG
jgi:hypothetical protein